MKKVVPLFLLLAALAACAVPTPEPAPVSAPPKGDRHTYSPIADAILNPERGFFTPYELPGPVGFSAVRITGNTLVHLNIRLDDWREGDLPQSLLDGLDGNFADMRGAGVKAIIRFAYNQGPYPDSMPDASKAWVLRHIEQLKPLLQKNGDVIAWAEAGFIGAWGEWHTSTNGLDNLTDKRDILNAFLAALPAGRVAQVRYPANIIEMFPDPLDAAKARVGHHNDCFLSSDTDVGTYERDGTNTIARDQVYLAVLTRTTPMSGETCAPNPPRSSCPTALQEMVLLHFSAINEAYHKGILRSWESGGCLDEINNRLGYRLELREASINTQARPGGLLSLAVTLNNSGFAAPVNPRPVWVVLSPNAGEPVRIDLGLDAREWQPGVSSFTTALRLPSNLAPGAYKLALWLPDAAPTLRDNPLFAIRMANEDTWDETAGWNVLGEVQVSASAPGSAQKKAQAGVESLVSRPATGELPPKPAPTTAPTQGPTMVVDQAAPISDLKLSSSTGQLTVEFTYQGSPESYNGFQVFIDTGAHERSGYAAGEVEADYLLENDALYAYEGAGSDWSWSLVEQAVVSYENREQAARWSLSLADLGSPPSIRVAAQLVDTAWNEVYLTPSLTFTVQ